MKGLTVEVVNLEQVISTVASKLGVELISAAHLAAKKEGQVVFVKTQHRVPYHLGQLHASGRVEEGDVSAGEATVGIAYGGPAGAGRNTQDVDYAMIVHEDLEAKHLFGRTAKYVENPIREELESGRSAERMAATIREEMGWTG